MAATSAISTHFQHNIPLKSSSNETKLKIYQLPSEAKIGIAIERILDGQSVYFARGCYNGSFPFSDSLLEHVLLGLQIAGKQVTRVDDKDGSHGGGSFMRGTIIALSYA